MAAQESLILGDLNSPLYFTKSDHPDDGNQASEGREDCILPWCLRLLATRLQALAANDMRRCIQGLYDLAADARTGYQCSTSADSKSLWQGRLKDLGLRIGNALLEMGDLHGAKRLFESLIASTMAEVESSISPAKALVHAEEEEKAILAGWVAMLSLRMGDLEEARNWIDVGVAGSSGSAEQRSKRGVLDALYEMAEGKYDDAVTCWRALLEGPDHILAAHNLAACLVYTGHLSEVRSSSASF